MTDWNPPPAPQSSPDGVRAGPVIGGFFLGVVLGVVYMVAALAVGLSMSTTGGGSDIALLLLWSAPAAVGFLLLAFSRTRRAGAGFVLGISISFIVLSAVCVSPVALMG